MSSAPRAGGSAGHEELRYPIGQFLPSGALGPRHREEAIADIEALPERLRSAVHGLAEAQLDTPYRPGGWTLRQVVHHVADSHLNAYLRFKLTVAEEEPLVRTYDEAVWALEPDSAAGPPELSLRLLDALHMRWVYWMRLLPEAAWSRRVIHPDSGTQTLDTLFQYYVWHSRHHLAHVTGTRERNGW